MSDEYDVEVRLLAITPEAEHLIEEAGRVCYDSQPGSGADRIQRWIKVGHESMLEHASATLYIRCSRVVTHELVRHRIAAYSQRSQRYVNESEPRFIVPAEVRDEDRAEWIADTQAIFDIYRKWLGRGYEKQIARYHLPNSCQTIIIATWNFREIRHIVRLRASRRAQPEMRQVARQILHIMLKQAPGTFGDLKELANS